MQTDKPLIFIPTYNEKENILVIHRYIRDTGLTFDILFIDDNSPDGTGERLDVLAKEDLLVRVLHRSGKLGIGSAHLMAINWAYDNGYSTLVTMDCDLTHSPECIPELVRHAEDADVVVGSRFLQADSLADWNVYRKTLTHIGHILTRHLLRVPYDATGAFRVYRLDRLPRRLFSLVSSTGYSFFFESLYLLCLTCARIKEIPIALTKRTYGHSKMRWRDILTSLRTLATLVVLSSRCRAKVKELRAAEPGAKR